MRIIFAIDKTRFPYMKELCKELEKYHIEYLLVDDLDIYNKNTIKSKYFRWIKTPKQFNKIIQEFKPDLVITERTSHFAYLVLKKNIPLGIFLRGDLWDEMEQIQKENKFKIKRIKMYFKRKISEKCFKESDFIISICNYLDNKVKIKILNKKTFVMYQGINQNYWKQVENKKLHHPNIGLLQNANIWKKTKEMLILEKIIPSFPKITFYWAGNGQYKNKILEKLARFENFKSLGHLDYPDQVRDFLSGIDVYCLLSGLDMSPHSIIEAQILGKPVIATNVGGVSESMIDNKTGFLIEKGNTEELIEKLSLLINDEQKRKDMGDEGKKFVEDNFNWDKIAKEFVNILKYKIN